MRHLLDIRGGVTDGRTDRHSYRDAMAYLKKNLFKYESKSSSLTFLDVSPFMSVCKSVLFRKCPLVHLSFCPSVLFRKCKVRQISRWKQDDDHNRWAFENWAQF